MFGFWGPPLSLLLLLTLGALILWPILGAVQALLCYCAALLALVAYHLMNLAALERWLRNPSQESLPQSSGIWDQIFSYLSRMWRKRTQSESKLSAALVRFRQAGAAMPEGLVLLDGSDRIEWCNPKAELHFGLDARSDAGQQITHLVRQPQFVEYLQSDNPSEPLILRMARRGERILSVQGVPYGDAQKLIFSRDITRWERVETMRRDFVANVSHELRTPLTVLAGFLETLLDAPKTDKAMIYRSLGLMREQAQRMQRLVEDLLTLSKLENAREAPHEEHVDVSAMLAALQRDAVTLSAGRHQIHLKIDCADGLCGTEDELRSAFSNLVGNAVQYTPDGGSISLIWQNLEGKGIFSVRDTGIGIEAEHIPRLTERFYRVDRSRSRSTGGTGLGLAIVKHVLNRHEGWLEIESEPGRGSTFRAVFPAQRLSLGETGAAEEEPLLIGEGH